MMLAHRVAPAVAAGALCALTAASASPETPGLMRDISAPEVAALLDARGYSTERDVDSMGAPLVQAMRGGRSFTVEFYGCDVALRPTRCDSLTFVYDAGLAGGLSHADANAWNAATRHASVYLAGGDVPTLSADVLLAGGVTEAHVQARIDLWQTSISSFLGAVDG